MSQINLAEAVKLKSILKVRIHDLEDEMRRNAFTRIEKGETPKVPARTLAIIETELDNVRKDIRTLDKLMYRANIDHTIIFNDIEMPIVEAIELATQLRAKASFQKSLGESEKEELQYGFGDAATIYQVALFDPEQYRLNALQTEKEAHKLSNLINAKNYSIHLQFDDSKYF